MIHGGATGSSLSRRSARSPPSDARSTRGTREATRSRWRRPSPRDPRIHTSRRSSYTVSGSVEFRDEPSSASAVRIDRRLHGAYRLSAGLVVPRPINEVFEFFADAHDLEAITPPWLRFRLRRSSPLPVQKGTMIDYRLRLHWLPLHWRSEITIWDPPHRFVDEQRHGPYREWTHEHSFHDLGGTTEVRDRVDYVLRLRDRSRRIRRARRTRNLHLPAAGAGHALRGQPRRWWLSPCARL